MHLPSEVWHNIVSRVVVQDARMLNLSYLQSHSPVSFKDSICQGDLLWYYASRSLYPRWLDSIRYADIVQSTWRQYLLEDQERVRAWQCRRYGATCDEQEDCASEADMQFISMNEHRAADGAPVDRAQHQEMDLKDADWQQQFHALYNKQQLKDALVAAMGLTSHEARMLYCKLDTYHNLYSMSNDCRIVAGTADLVGRSQRFLFILDLQQSNLVYHAAIQHKEQLIDLDWPHQMMITAAPIDSGTINPVSQYKYYDISQQQPHLLTRLTLLGSLRQVEHHFWLSGSPEAMLIGQHLQQTVSPISCIAVRVDLTTRQQLALHYLGDPVLSDNPLYQLSRRLIFTEHCNTLCIWSSITGELLARLDRHSPHQYYVYLMATPVSSVNHTASVDHQRQHRLLAMRHAEGGVHIEVWVIQLPQSTCIARWQDTLNGEQRRVVPEQPFELVADPKERVQLCLLYTLPPREHGHHYLGVYGGLLLSEVNYPVPIGKQIVAVSVETGEELLRLPMGGILYEQVIPNTRELLLFHSTGVYSSRISPRQPPIYIVGVNI